MNNFAYGEIIVDNDAPLALPVDGNIMGYLHTETDNEVYGDLVADYFENAMDQHPALVQSNVQFAKETGETKQIS